MRYDAPLSRRLFDALAHTPNLTALRIRNDCAWFLPMAVCLAFLDVISSGVFQLRSLVAPFTFSRHSPQLETALLSHKQTLRLLGVQLIEGRETDPWRAYAHDDCIRFAFQLFGNVMALTLAHPNPDRRTIDAVARSLPPAVVGELLVTNIFGLPGPDVVRLLAQHFPRVNILSYHFDTTAGGMDTKSVLDAAVPFEEAHSLIIRCPGGTCERLAGDFHVATASALADAGSKVKFILFPDGVTVRLEDGQWSKLDRRSLDE